MPGPGLSMAEVGATSKRSPAAWGEIARSLFSSVVSENPVGVCMILKSRHRTGQTVSFRNTPRFGQGAMMDALRRHFTVEQFDQQFRPRAPWAYHVRYGDYDLLLSPGGPHMPAPIQGCFYICISGPTDQRAILVLGCVPPTEQISRNLTELERVLTS